ncbi:hypothetical protein HYR99_35125 [Candidatus Poribacteria bacterium]|nr:hypothetical protein [Candidatus Poribacteria bacterium]
MKQTIIIGTRASQSRSQAHLRQVFIWGSYVTNKIISSDIDLLLVMSKDFDSDNVAYGLAFPLAVETSGVWVSLVLHD